MSTHPDCQHDWTDWVDFRFGRRFFDGGRCGRERICLICLDWEREYRRCSPRLNPMTFECPLSNQMGRFFLVPLRPDET